MTSSNDRYRAGDVYFLVFFVDPDLTVPVIRTIRFIETVSAEGGARSLLFQSVDEDAEKIAFEETSVAEVVLTGDELLERLRRCFDGTLASMPR